MALAAPFGYVWWTERRWCSAAANLMSREGSIFQAFCCCVYVSLYAVCYIRTISYVL